MVSSRWPLGRRCGVEDAWLQQSAQQRYLVEAELY